jgi:hypothetical protein
MVRRQRADNAASTTLSSGINDTVTSMTVVSATGFPTEGDFFVSINGETVLVTAVSGTTFTIVRGQEGTTADSHGSGSAVKTTITAGEFTNRLKDAGQVKTLSYGRLIDSSGSVITAASLTEINGGSSAKTDFADGVIGYECKAHTSNDVSGIGKVFATGTDIQLTVHFDCPAIDDPTTPNYFGLYQRQTSGGAMKGIVLYPDLKVEVHERATYLAAPSVFNMTHGAAGRRDLWFRVKIEWDKVASTDYFTWSYSVDGVHWWEAHTHSFASSSVNLGYWQTNRTINYRRGHILAWHEELI